MSSPKGTEPVTGGENAGEARTLFFPFLPSKKRGPVFNTLSVEVTFDKAPLIRIVI